MNFDPDVRPVLLDTLEVQVRPGMEPKEVAQIVWELGGKMIRYLQQIRMMSVQIDHTQASTLFLAYENHPDVTHVTFSEHLVPHSVTTYFSATQDSFIDSQYPHKRMNIFHAWKYTRGAGITASIVDSGIRPDYASWPEFGPGRFAGMYSSAPGGVMPYDGDGQEQHGTMCIATFAARAGKASGTVGIAPECSFLAVSDVVPGNNQNSSNMVWDALLWAVNNGAKIISLSQGFSNLDPTTPTDWDANNPGWGSTFTTIATSGAILFMAAGNWRNDDTVDNYYSYPAAMGYLYDAVSVACSDYGVLDRPVSYATHGSTMHCVCPGHQVFVPFRVAVSGNATTEVNAGRIPTPWTASYNAREHTLPLTGVQVDYRTFLASSAASPMAAAVATLIWSANPSLTRNQVRDILLRTADKGQHPVFNQRFRRVTVSSSLVAGDANLIGVPNAGKGVLKALSLANPGVVYPYVNFWGDNVSVSVVSGSATMYLRGVVDAELIAYSTDPIVRVQLWADSTDLIYDGPVRSSWDYFLPVDSSRFIGKTVKVVGISTATSGSEEYNDIVAVPLS